MYTQALPKRAQLTKDYPWLVSWTLNCGFMYYYRDRIFSTTITIWTPPDNIAVLLLLNKYTFSWPIVFKMLNNVKLKSSLDRNKTTVWFTYTDNTLYTVNDRNYIVSANHHLEITTFLPTSFCNFVSDWTLQPKRYFTSSTSHVYRENLVIINNSYNGK